MDLVNTEHIVLFGSGSEWFWSMVGGVVVAVTFILIYRERRAQGAADAKAPAASPVAGAPPAPRCPGAV